MMSMKKNIMTTTATTSGNIRMDRRRWILSCMMVVLTTLVVVSLIEPTAAVDAASSPRTAASRQRRISVGENNNNNNGKHQQRRHRRRHLRGQEHDIQHQRDHEQRELIVGGQDAPADRYPAMVYLSDRTDKLSCGGTLISPTVVLTAGHCELALVVEAVFGRYNVTESFLEQPSSVDTSTTFSSMEVEQRQESSNYERVRVKQELQHPNFNRNTLQYDAMLVILEHPPSFLSDLDRDTNFTFMKLHRPDTMNVTEMIDGRITSPTDRTDTVSQEQLIALGWGHTQTGQGPRASFLQQASLGYVPNDVCELSRENSASYQNRIHDDMMCTFASGRDTCNGDSGGPIIIPGLTPAEDVQVGIVSWGEDCADAIFPGVASRVSHSYDWIERWVCALDGESAPEWFNCTAESTYSPSPTTAPSKQGETPQPTIVTVRIIISIHFDVFANELSWQLSDSVGNVVAERPTAYYRYENFVKETVSLIPGETYIFTISDSYGDGIAGEGYYEIYAEDGDEALVTGVGLFGRDKTHIFVAPSPPPLMSATARTSQRLSSQHGATTRSSLSTSSAGTAYWDP